MVPGAHPCQAGQESGSAAPLEWAGEEEEDELMAGPPAEEGSAGFKMAPRNLPLPLLAVERCWAQRESRVR